jgi:hypothetical protein
MGKLATTVAGAVLCALVVTISRPAAADVQVNISKSSQRMSVLVDGTARYNWAVSTGAKKYTTPNGVYRPQWLARKWRSKKYNNAPMPHSIFFHDGYAIHGTTEISRLGRIASHGCVRLHPENAAKLYELVEKQMRHTRVVVSDDAIEPPGEAPKPKKPSMMISEMTPAKRAPGQGLESLAMAPELPAPAAAVREKPGRDEARAKQGKAEKPRRYRYADRFYGFRW